MSKGQKAPFQGILLSREALSKIISDYEAKLKEAKAETEKVRKEYKVQIATDTAICKVKLEGEKKKEMIAQTGCNRQLTVFEKALKSCEERRNSVWKSPYLNFALGAVIGGGVCAAASYGISR